MSTYPSLAAYNADIEAARDAYASDMAVQNGLCAVCQHKPKDGHMRRCWRCRRAKLEEAATIRANITAAARDTNDARLLCQALGLDDA